MRARHGLEQEVQVNIVLRECETSVDEMQLKFAVRKINTSLFHEH